LLIPTVSAYKFRQSVPVSSEAVYVISENIPFRPVLNFGPVLSRVS